MQSTSAKKQVMEDVFGKPGRFFAAGTYMMLHVKTAKFVEPFSQYANEEEYLTNFNTAFQVTLAAASPQSFDAGSHNHVASHTIAGESGAILRASEDAQGILRFAAARSRFHNS